jgi:hypothetical protein
MMAGSISDNSFSSPTPSTDSRQRRLLSSSRSSRSIHSSPAGKSIMKKPQSISVKNLMGGNNSFNDSYSSTSTSTSSINNIRLRRRRSLEITPPTTPRTPKTPTKASAILVGAEAKIQNIMNEKKVKQGRRSDIRKSLDSAILLDNDNDNNISGPQSPNAKQRREKQDNELKSPRSRIMVRSRSVVVVDDDDSQLNSSIEGSYELKPESRKILVRSKSTVVDSNNEYRNETAAKKSGVERRLRHRSKSRTRDGTRDRSKSRSKDTRDRSKSRTRDGTRDRSKSRPRDTRDRSKSRPRDGTQLRSVDPNSSTSTRRLRRHRSRSSSKGADTVRDSDRRRARSLSRGADAVRDSDRRSRKSKSGDDNDNGVDDNDDDNSVATSATNTTAASRRGRRPPRQKTQRESDNDDDDDDDTKSVGSIKSVVSRESAASGITSKRGRRPKGVLNTRSTQKISSDHSNQKISLDDTSNNRSSQNKKILLSSPGPDTRKHKDKNKMAQSMSSLDYHFESHSPISSHLESDNNLRGVKHLSIVDEEKSIDMSRTGSMDKSQQSILLQFDPTTENGVQTVNQTKAKKTSETIRRSDGTKSKFEISELAGLPTFERTKQQQQQQYQHGSESNRSMLSNTCSDGSDSVEGQHGSRPPSFLSLGKPRLSITRSSPDSHQNPGETPEEAKTTGSNNNNKWSLSTQDIGNNLQAKKSAFFQRVQKSKLQVTDGFMNRPSMDRTSLSHQALDDDDDSVGY